MSTEIRAVIADDERLARMRLRRLCEIAGDVDVVAEAKDSDDALAQVAEHRPHVLFLDVQMPGRGGLGVGEALPRDSRPLIVFVTAHSEYAVGAFAVEALDYLLKPFEKERFEQALARVRDRLSTSCSGAPSGDRDPTADATRFVHPSAATSALGVAVSPGSPSVRPERLAVRSGFRTRFVEVKDIDYVVAEGNYVSVYTGAKSHLLRETMNAMEASLDSRVFLRVHRSTIVRIDRIEEIEPMPNGEYVLRLRGGATVVSARGSRQRLFAALGMAR